MFPFQILVLLIKEKKEDDIIFQTNALPTNLLIKKNPRLVCMFFLWENT